MDDLGMAPNWLGSMTFRIAGPACIDTTKSSATLESDGVSDMGLIGYVDTFLKSLVFVNGLHTI